MYRSTKTSVAAVGLTAAATVLAYGAKRYLGRSLSVKAQERLEFIARRRPANIGDPLDQVETPCLVVDLDALEKNLTALPRSLHAKHPKVAIRPHAKAHKSADIGKLQLRLSKAVGLCCQKVVEAEAMAAGGIKDILLSNEIYGFDRYERMAELVKQGAQVMLIFDTKETIEQAQKVAEAAKITFGALVDVNVGQNRCGVDTEDEAIVLAKAIEASKNLQLRGIQAYHGGAQHIRKYEDKSKVINAVCAKAKQVRDRFIKEDLNCEIVTGGGTGTYLLEAASGVFTEVQPGSYLFNDADYARNFDAKGDKVHDWEQSLFVLTTVMSTNAEAPRSVVDAGMKSVSLDSGVPLVYSSIDQTPLRSLEYQGGGDEHGILVPSAGTKAKETEIPMPTLGSKLLLIPGHCDPTTNLYDFVVGFRNGIVEKVWTIGARSPGN